MSTLGARGIEVPAPAVRDLVRRALAEDLGPLGDLTAALIDADLACTAGIVARADGVLAGTQCATEVFSQIDAGLHIEWQAEDGAAITKGDRVGKVTGTLRSIVTAERTALNFLCHLSGVATLTHRFVEAAGRGARIWDTRKTLPGLRALEKAAVRAGGGVNHRASLSEFVLVKDNHLGGIGIREAVRRAHALWPGRMVEVECDDIEQMREAISAGADMVLLDNMAPGQVAECVEVARASARTGFLVEVSGGVTLENVRAYADAGADLISTSVITQSAPTLDLALDLAERVKVR